MNTHRTTNDPHLTRRSWLAGLTITGFGLLGADKPAPPLEADPAEIVAISRKVRKAGLANFRISESEHFIGTGNAPDDFREKALNVCELIYKSYRTHLLTKKIELSRPAHKMAVVILADRKTYEVFKGEVVDEAEGGHFDIDANYLVTYKFDEGNRQAAALNTFTLVHEATHQLTYNTGLLSRQADVPVAISEGFAMYCEMWQVGRKEMGKLNTPWMNVLRADGLKGWIPVAKLLTEDDLLSDPKTYEMARAESWFLIFDLFRTDAGTKSLRSYLADLRTRDDPKKRIADAEKAFGDLDRLDSTLKKAAIKILKSINQARG